jgi:DNA-binding transcriptional LysR family regulator
MRIDTLGVQAFIAIADHGGFGRAAAALHITQTAITRRLQNLESALAIRLVERSTRATALTGIGREFLPHARRLLGDLENVLTEIRESGRAMRGEVTIACVPTVGVQYLPRIIQQYSALHPANRIRILDHASFDVADAVLRREAEFGINILGPQHADLASVPLIEDRFVLVCRDDHPLARRRSVAWRQIEAHPVIFVGQASGNRRLLDAALGGDEAPVRAQYEVQRSSTALGLVAEGVGVAVVPRIALQRGAYPTLRVIALTEPVVSRTLALISRRNAYLSPAAQALYDVVVRQAGGGRRPPG